MSHAMRVGLAAAVVTVAAARLVAGQGVPRPSLLQLEVGDSIGLPLPDAKIEVFAITDRGRFRDWVTIDPSDLPEGVHLLRFSQPGYQPTVFSVPLRHGTRVSLRVRLGAERDTTRKGPGEATEVRTAGLRIEGRATTDILKARRVLDRGAIERASPASIAALLRDAKGMGVVVSPGGVGSYTVGAVGGGMYGCPLPVMINGDWRLITSFDEANRGYSPESVEAVELVSRVAAKSYSRRAEDAECGVLVIWVRV